MGRFFGRVLCLFGSHKWQKPYHRRVGSPISGYSSEPTVSVPTA